MSDTDREASGGILHSLGQLGATFVGLLHTRVEIVATELEEERARIRQAILLALIAGVCLAIAALLAVSFLVVIFWESNRLLAIGVLFFIFFGIGGGCVLRLVHEGRTRPRLFATTLSELAKDGERLRKAP